jgi:hypothetical protein
MNWLITELCFFASVSAAFSPSSWRPAASLCCGNKDPLLVDSPPRRHPRTGCFRRNASWSSDFEGGDDDDSFEFAKIYAQRVTPTDLSGVQTRQFSLGPDLVLSTYLGNMGFEEVTDWEYYLQDEEDPLNRQVVQPGLFDSSKPKRTRKASGSVVRLFRGEFVGQLGGMLGSMGLDRRLLVKEYFGDLALQLASSELAAVGRLQTGLLQRKADESAKKGDWIATAASRSVNGRVDNSHVASLLQWLQSDPFVGILGEVNLAELDDEDMDANDFYRALGVPPPKSGAVWVVYEYAGLSSVQSFASLPPQARRNSLPPQRGFLGAIVKPPPLPAFEQRAKYVVQGIMKQSIQALATLHEGGMVHRSIGRGSFILSSTTMDRRQASSPMATMVSQLVVKLTDFGFAGLYKESTDSEEFCARARAFGLYFRKGDATVASTNFAMAEDMHALGFVFLGLLLTSLAELPTPDAPMPATDEDSLQRLLGDIFDKDFAQFREYVEEEDAWGPLVELLDRNNGAGWTVLETLMLAREKAAKTKDGSQLFTIRGLLSNPFFAT